MVRWSRSLAVVMMACVLLVSLGLPGAAPGQPKDLLPNKSGPIPRTPIRLAAQLMDEGLVFRRIFPTTNPVPAVGVGANVLYITTLNASGSTVLADMPVKLTGSILFNTLTTDTIVVKNANKVELQRFNVTSSYFPFDAPLLPQDPDNLRDPYGMNRKYPPVAFGKNATTNKGLVILPVPKFAQQTKLWCWAAAGEMIMNYLGVDVPQCVQVQDQVNDWYHKNEPPSAIPPKCCQNPVPEEAIQPSNPEFARYARYKIDFKEQPQKLGVTWWQSGTPETGGTGYAVGDILTVLEGNPEEAAQLKVEKVSPGGVITYVTVQRPGRYPAIPPPGNTGVNGGKGTGAIFNVPSDLFQLEALPLTFDQLKNQINSGSPVSFLWNWRGGGGHYMVIIGYDVKKDANNQDVNWVCYLNPEPANINKTESLTGGTAGAMTWVTYDYFIGSDSHRHQRCQYAFSRSKQ